MLFKVKSLFFKENINNYSGFLFFITFIYLFLLKIFVHYKNNLTVIFFIIIISFLKFNTEFLNFHIKFTKRKLLKNIPINLFFLMKLIFICVY